MTNESPRRFIVDVEGIGHFEFHPRSMRREFAIARQIREFNGGLPVDPATQYYIEAVSELMVLTDVAPEGWMPDQLLDLNLYDENAYANLAKVWEALLKEEESFRNSRKATAARGEGAGAGDVEDGRVLVPPDVSAAAE